MDFTMPSSPMRGSVVLTSPLASTPLNNDRFIPERRSQDLTLSLRHFGKDATPLGGGGGRGSAGGSGAFFGSPMSPLGSAVTGAATPARGSTGGRASVTPASAAAVLGSSTNNNAAAVAAAAAAVATTLDLAEPYASAVARSLFPAAAVAGGSFAAAAAVATSPSTAAAAAAAGSTATAGGSFAAAMATDGTLGGSFASDGAAAAAASGGESERYRRSLGVVYEANRARGFRSRGFRVIPQTPERILDAPELQDDFYLNLIDWSSRNVLTVALAHTVYLWRADTGNITQLASSAARENVVTGVAWHADGGTLAVGNNESELQLWDAETQRLVRSVAGAHASRIGALAWCGSVLASGGRDARVVLHDIREPRARAVLAGHTQEVCGLKWSASGQLLASGGNDNVLNIWDIRRDAVRGSIAAAGGAGGAVVAPSAVMSAPLWSLREHTAAIKALAWHPQQPHLLVSGGGTADKTLRFWDTATGQCTQSVDTRSQVCGALWSRCGRELVTSHGYSDNQLTLWRYPSLRRLADLSGHTSRVLHLAMSPDGNTVVSAAGDETIRFWRCFAAPAGEDESAGAPVATVPYGALSRAAATNSAVMALEDNLR